jgi:hypothetical protein
MACIFHPPFEKVLLLIYKSYNNYPVLKADSQIKVAGFVKTIFHRFLDAFTMSPGSIIVSLFHKICYSIYTCMEDRATLGSDPSATAGGYTDGLHPRVWPFYHQVAHKAINPKGFGGLVPQLSSCMK